MTDRFRHYEVPVRFTWNLNGAEVMTIRNLLFVAVRGYEIKGWELTQARHLLLSAERFLEATYGEIGKPRTGFKAPPPIVTGKRTGTS